MKVCMVKHPGGALMPANEEAVAKLAKVENGDHEISITLKQNSRLHRKIWAFFAFCTRYYYGDVEAHKDEYQLEHVRKKITIMAGYAKTVFLRDGIRFEIVALSISYEKMEPEDRANFYSRIVDVALRKVFHTCDDDNVINELISWF